MKGCKYPDCKSAAVTTWALVPLCVEHYGNIHAESMRYYRGTLNIQYKDRAEYLKIAKLIPWSRINMGEVLPDGTVRWD